MRTWGAEEGEKGWPGNVDTSLSAEAACSSGGAATQPQPLAAEPRQGHLLPSSLSSDRSNMLPNTMKRPGEVLVRGDEVGGDLGKRQRQEDDSEGSAESLGSGNDGDIGPQHPNSNTTTTQTPEEDSFHHPPPDIVVVDESDNGRTVHHDVDENPSDGLFIPSPGAGSTNAASSLRSTPIAEDSANLICYGMVIGSKSDAFF